MANDVSEQSDLILDDSQIFEKFLEGLHSKATRRVYREWIRSVVGEPSDFLKLARENRWKAQMLLMDWVVKRRDELSPITVRSMLASVKSLTDSAEIILSWKKIQRVAKKVHPIGKDQPVPYDAAQMMYDRGDLRLKWILGLLMSGIRVGAFAWMQVKDLQEIDSIGLLRVYPNEVEEYHAFLTAEAMKNWHEYRDYRIRSGEIIAPSSPLVRRVFDQVGHHSTIVRKLTPHAVQLLMNKEWSALGLRQRNFKPCHGWRKLFRTRITNAGLSTEDAEVMLGHKDSYYKPSLEELAAKFLQFQFSLELSKASEAERTAKQAVKDKEFIETSVMTELRLLRLEKEKSDRENKERLERLEKAYRDSKSGVL
jgi:hypothetical protein